MTLPLSVIVPTFNEELNIGNCLDSVSWCDDIVVLDSGSTDTTREVAISKGARVELRAFDNYANQRNYALQNIEYRHPWVLMLDADEVVPEDLQHELQEELNRDDQNVTLYRIRRMDYFMGTWLKHSTHYNSLWLGRVMRPRRVWIERTINEEYHTDGVTRYLLSALVHYPFSKGLDAWINKHNRYSTMEANLIANDNQMDCDWAELFKKDPVVRRKSLKALSYSLPGRPLLMFIGRYIISGGILDGRAGLKFCVLKTWYEYLIDCKIKELRRRA